MLFRRLGYGDDRVRLVVNRHQKRARIPDELLAETAGLRISARISHDYQLLQGLAPARRLEQLIEQADADVTVAQILGWSAGLLFTGAMLALALSRAALLLVALLGAVGPTLWLLSARARRGRRLSEQLPDALQMMSRSLRAGHCSGSWRSWSTPGTAPAPGGSCRTAPTPPRSPARGS